MRVLKAEAGRQTSGEAWVESTRWVSTLNVHTESHNLMAGLNAK